MTEMTAQRQTDSWCPHNRLGTGAQKAPPQAALQPSSCYHSSSQSTPIRHGRTMGTRFGAERAEPEHVPEHRKNASVPMFSVQWNTSKFSEHLDGYYKP